MSSTSSVSARRRNIPAKITSLSRMRTKANRNKNRGPKWVAFNVVLATVLYFFVILTLLCPQMIIIMSVTVA